MAAPPRDRIGDFLLREGLVTQEQLSAAVRDAKDHGTRVGFALIKLNIIAEPDLTKALARQYRVPAVDLDRVQVDPRIVKLFPPDLAFKHYVLPIRWIGRMLTVAMADPTDAGAIDSLKFVTRCDIEPVIVGEMTLKRHLDQFYQAEDIEEANHLTQILEQIEAPR